MNMLVSGAALAASSPVLPALAETLGASPNPALKLWHERQRHVEALRPLVIAYHEASERLPDWAKTGHRMIDHEGKPCGEETGCTLDSTVTPPTNEGDFRVVRPSIYGVQQDFDFFMRVFAGDPGSPGYEAVHAKARQNMEQRVQKIEARERERNRIYEELGLCELDDEIQTECELIGNAEWALVEMDPSPDKYAAQLMAQLCQDCSDDAIADGNGLLRHRSGGPDGARGAAPELV